MGVHIDKFLKRSKAVHEDEKAPFLAAGRTVDTFKHFLIDDIDQGKKVLNAARKAYADKKAAEERRRREEEARLAREEEERIVKANARMLAALRKIVKGEGAYNRDNRIHASNTIDAMKAVAQAAIDGVAK